MKILLDRKEIYTAVSNYVLRNILKLNNVSDAEKVVIDDLYSNCWEIEVTLKTKELNETQIEEKEHKFED